MTPERIGYLVGAIIGGVFAGAVCGLIPFALAKWKRRVSLGVGALVTCIICGALLGVLLAGPAALVFSAIILILGKSEGDASPPQG